MQKFVREVISIAYCLIIGMIVAWIFDIDPTKEYGWFAGGFDGAVFVPNYIISLFNSNWLTKAPIHTSAYNVFWWISTVTTVAGYGITTIKAITALFSALRK